MFHTTFDLQHVLYHENNYFQNKKWGLQTQSPVVSIQYL